MIRRLGRWAVGAAAIVFGCVGYAYLALPDVRVLATENPTSTAFTELRAREARADGKTPKHVQKWIAYRRISPALTRAVLVAEDAAFWQHDGVDEAAVRKYLLDTFNMEIGAGLGPLAGKVWRVGLMGASSSPRLVVLLVAALQAALAHQGKTRRG